MDLKLIKAVREILKLAQDVSGKPFEFIQKPDLGPHATVKIARKSMPQHLVFYKDRNRNLNHLIAHECGHILRLFNAPENERLVPFTITNIHFKEKAYKSMESDIVKLSGVLDFKKLPQILEMWFNGLIQQLTNLPPDIMIEKWIYNNYPALHPYQTSSLEKQYQESVSGLSDGIKKITPSIIYNSSNLMNCVYFTIVSKILKINFTKAFQNTTFMDESAFLLEITENDYQDDYIGDISMIKKWTDYLELQDWYDWRHFEDIPDNYATQHL